MYLIGLTGNVGSGKSTVAQIWKTERGAHIVDADKLGKHAVRKGSEALKELVAAFGADILLDDGELDRRKMAKMAFSDPETLEKLNSIVHPSIVNDINSEIAAAEREGLPALVVDAALIFEFGIDKIMDCNVVVDSPLELRKKRVLGRGNVDEATFDLLVHRQIDAGELKRLSDHVIVNDSDMDKLRVNALKIYDIVVGSDNLK